jgi:hypothetical protein
MALEQLLAIGDVELRIEVVAVKLPGLLELLQRCIQIAHLRMGRPQQVQDDDRLGIQPRQALALLDDLGKLALVEQRDQLVQRIGGGLGVVVHLSAATGIGPCVGG